MITKLRLQNFRGFDDHTLELRPLTILVGANNAGKSTIVEALRLVSLVAARFRGLHYQFPPRHLEKYVSDKVVQPSLANLDIQFRHLFHCYGEPPAIVSAEFSNGSAMKIYLDGEENCFASISNERGESVLNQTWAKNTDIPVVEIMPQIGPVRLREEVLNEDYVRKSVSSNLVSLHFRNQLKIFKERYSAFCDSVIQTWPGVKVQELIVPGPMDEKVIYLEIRNEDFVGEIGTMGHGLQMWMQTVWFLSRASDATTVILDEPDVYMHADMQRRLIRHIRGRFPQVIIATHSVEIMAEVESDAILVIDRRRSRSQFAANTPAVQSLVSRIGSAHNLHMARLWNSRRLILVEGKDMRFLKAVQNILFPNTRRPLDAIPNMSLGGWTGWNYAIGSDMLLRNAIGQEIITYCIFDRDYHTIEAIEKRHKQAKERGVNLVIWKQKEIENYFLVPQAISRIIRARIAAPRSAPLTSVIETKLRKLADLEEDSIFDALSSELLAEDKAGGPSKANQKARAIIRDAKRSHGSLIQIASGKALMSSLSEWSQAEFDVSLSSSNLFNELRLDEIHSDIHGLVTAIEQGKPFTL
ncbi:MAG TPA: AAA family ATPase [Verrucomicrobiales bacterium]|nr:AAA family ATPase [Verrucomicrobiales bacterium]